MAFVTNKRVTAEDVLRCGSPYRDCELWDGAAIVCEPSGGESEIVAARVVGPLYHHVHTHRLGWTFLSSQGFLLARNPDRLLAPDGAFLSGERIREHPVTTKASGFHFLFQYGESFFECFFQIVFGAPSGE